MTAELPLSDDECETPIERVLRAAMLAEAARAGEHSQEGPTPPNEVAETQDVPETIDGPVHEAPPVQAVEEAPAEVVALEEPGQAALPQEDVLSQTEPPEEVIAMTGPAEPAVEALTVEEPGRPAPVPEATVSTEATTVMATPEAIAAWTEALRSVERSINEAADAIRFLRATIRQMAPLLRSIEGLEELVERFEDRPQHRPEPPALDDALVGHEEEAEAPPGPTPLPQLEGLTGREWAVQRRKTTPKERPPEHDEPEAAWTPPPGRSRPTAKPVTLVPDDTPAPYAYKVTIEDRQGPVELVQLHRALASVPSVRNLSLLNYVSGVASLSLEAMDEIQPSELENAVKKVMKRNCSVVPHESNVMLMQMED